jgi:hypothetical protein
MSRETRANLIFISVLILLMAPPITMTLIKRWKEPGRNLMPPPIRGSLTYIDRTAGVAKHMPRVVPPRLGRFVVTVAERLMRLQPGLVSRVGDGRFAPIMSEQLYLQAIAEGAHEAKYRVALIGWAGDFIPIESMYKFTGTRRDGTVHSGRLESYEMQNMPIELRKELQEHGYILPPDGLIWMIVTFDGERPVDSISMEYRSDRTSLVDTIRLRELPTTSPAAR